MSYDVFTREIGTELVKEIESEKKFLTFSKLFKILKLNALVSR